MKNFKLPKWAVVIVAAAVFLPLAVDWVAPGAGARIAAEWLRGGSLRTAGPAGSGGFFPLWGWLVGFAGRDVAALGLVSVGAGLLCVWLVAAIFGAIFAAAVRVAKMHGVKGEECDCAWVENAAVLLAGLGFALTPGFLAAATRVSPLMVALAPPLAAVALVVGVLCRTRHNRGASSTVLERLQRGKGRLLLATGLAGYSAYELLLARRIFLSLAFPAFWVWLAVGLTPALVIVLCIRKRWLGAMTSATDEAGRFRGARNRLRWSFAAWGVMIAAMGGAAVFSEKLDEGRVASRIVARIIANAEGRGQGKIAVVSDGALDELFFFMLPEGVRLISLARERDPAYGRELSEWLTVLGGGKGEQGTGTAGQRPRTLGDGPWEDLSFAAELGPQALVDEWVEIDKAGFERAVASVANFFPTRKAWDEARAELKGMRQNEPMAQYLRHLLGVCGNTLGCRRVENGKMKMGDGESEREAWSIFETIVDEVEPENYVAHLNLLGMVQLGYAAPKDEVDHLARRCQRIEKNLKDWEHVRYAAWLGGQLCAAPDDVAKYEKARQKDAIAVLKLGRHDPTANATLGSLAGSRGDYKRAAWHLRRAIAAGKASIDVKTDFARTLVELGQLDEAESFAREAVTAFGEAWGIRETLAAILIRRGQIGEGERELRKAEELAAKAGIPKGRIVSFEIDRARLLKAKGDHSHFKIALRQLESRKDLTDAQRAEVNGL